MRDIAQVFQTLWSVQENSILFLFLLLSLFRWEITEGLRIGMQFWGEQAASLRFAAACREPISNAH